MRGHGEVEREVVIATRDWERVTSEGYDLEKWLGPRRPWRLLVQKEPIVGSAVFFRVHPIAFLVWRYRHNLGRSMDEIKNGSEVWRPLRRLLRRLVEDPDLEAACLSAVALAGVDGLAVLIPYTAREHRAIERVQRFARIDVPPEHAQCRSSSDRVDALAYAVNAIAVGREVVGRAAP